MVPHSDRPPDRGRTLVVRALRAVAIAALCLWGLYLLAAQTLLWTPLLRHLINEHEPTVHLEYAFAWSVWPGHVQVRALRLTSQDRGVQWQLDIDRVATTLVLQDLPRRIFHATRVEGDGLTFALRRRIPRPQLTPDRLEGLPSIAGFAPVPVAPDTPDEDIPDWRYDLMSVWLQGISVRNVRSVWIDRLRVQGDAQVAGAFYLKPIRRALIAPAELSGSALVLTHNGNKVLDPVQGNLALWLGPFDPRGITPHRLAGVFGLEARGTGRVAGLAFLSRIVRVPLAGGAGPLRFALHVRDGRVLAGTQLAAELHDAHVRRASLTANARQTAVSVVIPEGGGNASLRVETNDTTLKSRAGTDAARIESARLEIDSKRVDLSAPSPNAASFELRGGRLEDARAVFGAFRIAGAQVDGGHGAFAVHLAGPIDGLSGWARVSLADARVRAERLSIRTDVAVDAKVRVLDPRRGADLSGTEVLVDQARLADAGEEDTAPGWWARVALTRAALRLGPDGPLVDADFSARCRDARPIVGLYVRRADLPGFVSGLFAMEGLHTRGSAVVGKDTVAIRRLDAAGDRASIRAVYLADGKSKRGAALLGIGSLSVGVGLGDGGGVHVLGPGDWYASQERGLRAEMRPPAPPRELRPRARTPPAAKRPTR
ncbi:MAG TPA: hypothetical protein VE620_00940 [Myxococcales bacterium]|nr:hypothetical protein [Myxococcales bacterium]